MSAPPDLPDVVNRAFAVSRKAGYVSFCRNETGRLLAALAATRAGTMAEFGTGCGVGTAWLRSGVRGKQARILTAELDPKLAKPAGIVVLDDFAPCEQWPPITAGRVDSLREQWLTDERFTAVEVMVAPDSS